jgi:hypothetical protein
MSEDDLTQNGSKRTNPSTPKISNLERREIQAPLIARLLSGFISEIGFDKAMQVASKAIQADAMQSGNTAAEKYDGNTLKELLRVVREEWAEENALDFSVLEETDHKLSFNVFRCHYAEMYASLGLKEFGFCLSCNRDHSFIKGFNPRMKLFRTRTIMQGAEICDFKILIE